MTTEIVPQSTPASLTTAHLTTLRKPFQAAQHEFRSERNRTFTYITESAITTRLEDVDPCWSFELVSIARRDSQVYCHARLTVCGIARDGIGEANITTQADGRESGEPEKSAATDALRRAARLFGVGRYLLDTPASVQDRASLQQWLTALETGQAIDNAVKAVKAVTSKPAPFQTVGKAPGADKLTGKNGKSETYDPAAVRWSETVAAVIGTDNPYYLDRKHITATLRILVASGLLTIGAPVAEAVDMLNRYSTLRLQMDQDAAIAQLQFVAIPAANGNGKAVAS